MRPRYRLAGTASTRWRGRRVSAHSSTPRSGSASLEVLVLVGHVARAQQTTQRRQARRARRAGVTRGDVGVERAVCLVVRAAAWAFGSAGGELREVVDDRRRVDVCEAERTNAGGVDDPAALRPGKFEGDRRRRGVAPASRHVVDVAGRARGIRNEGVDQCRLADAGVPDEDADTPGEAGAQVVETVEVTGDTTTGRDQLCLLYTSPSPRDRG